MWRGPLSLWPVSSGPKASNEVAVMWRQLHFERAVQTKQKELITISLWACACVHLRVYADRVQNGGPDSIRLWSRIKRTPSTKSIPVR